MAGAGSDFAVPTRLQQAQTQRADPRLRAALPVSGKDRGVSERGLGSDARDGLRRERAVRAPLREPRWRDASKRRAPAHHRARGEGSADRSTAPQRTRLRLESPAEAARSASRERPSAEVALRAIAQFANSWRRIRERRVTFSHTVTHSHAWARRLLLLPTLSTLLFQACAENGPRAPGASGSAGSGQLAGASGSAGSGQLAGASGSVGDEFGSAGVAGDGGAGAGGDVAGAAGAPSAAGAAGLAGAEPDPADVIETGRTSVTQTARPAYGALLATQDGERSYVLESRRDVEAGPFGLPWRSRFRLAAYDHGELTWAFTADADDVIGDVVVHPSGELTLSLERHPPERNADDLVRLSHEGQVISVTTLASPLTIPTTDYGPKDPQPLFAMKSTFADATGAGWVRLLPEGEGLVVAFLSLANSPNDGPLSNRIA